LAQVGASSANISHSYQSAAAITNGSIVSLDPHRANYVQPSSTDNGSRIIGVAVAGNDSLIAVDTKPGTVQVATTGNVNTLVSTLNGDIHVGDQIAVSPLNGVGMKALPGSRIVGLAQTAFSSNTQGAKAQRITDKKGKSLTVYLGYVRAGIAIGASSSTANGIVLNSLQKTVQSLTGHTVSTPRIAISITVVAIALIALITLTYASIYSSIISVGRNPLAKYAVFRTLGAVLGMALLTTLVAGVAVFLLLR
jgi:hypothetical protein